MVASASARSPLCALEPHRDTPTAAHTAHICSQQSITMVSVRWKSGDCTVQHLARHTPLVLLFLYLISMQQGAMAALAPSHSRQGDVMIALNSAGNDWGNLGAAFIEAVWAFEQRAVVRDTSPGAVISSDPPGFVIGWQLDDHGFGFNGRATNISMTNWEIRKPPVHAQLGPLTSSMAIPSAELSHVTKHVQMGFSNGSPSLSNKQQYSYFLRSNAVTTLDTLAFLAVASRLSVSHLLVIYQDEALSVAGYSTMRDYAPASMDLYAERLVVTETPSAKELWVAALQRLRSRPERWITSLTIYWETEFWATLKEAGFFGPDRQWLAWSNTVFKPSPHFMHMVGAVGVMSVTSGPLMGTWKDWAATLSASSFPDFVKVGKNQLNDEYLQNRGTVMMDSFLVDGTFAVLFAIERLHAAGVPLADCRRERLRDELYKTDFEGVSGRVKFDANGDRTVGFAVWSVVLTGPVPDLNMLKVVGSWNSVDGLELGGWAGNRTSTRFDLLTFVNGSVVPPPLLALGCGKGRQPSPGEGTECVECPLGTFNPVQGNLKSCLPCEPGFHSLTKGSVACTGCPAGSFQNASGAPSCIDCSAGWFAAGVGSTSCQLCPRGTAAGVGSTMCAECARGLYASTTGNTLCTHCPSGFTTEFAGSIWPSACGCADGSVFVPNTSSSRSAGATSLHAGHCFDCQDPSLRNQYTSGLWCSGGLTCEAIENRTVVESFPCADLGSACLDFEDGCRHQCIVPVAQAASLCGSARYEAICQGWSVKTSALQHGDWLPNQDAIGWQNVAILGRLTLDTSGTNTTMYGTSAHGFSLIPRRPWCSPVRAGDPALRILAHPLHSVGSFPQPPLVKPGYYVVNRATAHSSGLRLSTPIDTKSLVGQSANNQVGAQVAATRPWSSDYASLLSLFDDGTPVPEAVPLFKCRSPEVCPGGGVGQCLPGHSGLACGQCAPQFFTNSRGRCSPCLGGSAAGWMMALVVIAVFIVFVLLYRMTSTPLAAQLSAQMSTALALGLTFNGLQTFGVISLLNIDLGDPLASILGALRLFLVDVDQLQWECAMEVTPIGKLSARLLIPPMACGMYLAIYILSHALHRVVPLRVSPCNVAHTVNCIGMVLQVLFISICMGVIVPFKCAEHPLGHIATLVDMPQQVCGVGDHVAMSVLGAVFLFLYPICAMAGCSYVVYILPQRTARDPEFLNYFKFLVSRFRFDRFYFGILFMLRNVSIAVVPVVNPNNPLLQQVIMCTLLLVALCAQAVLWPWAANEVNWLDLTCLVAMITTVVLTAGMVDSTTVDTSTIAIMAAVTVSLAFSLMFVVVGQAAVRVLGDLCAARQQCTAVAQRIRRSPDTARVDTIVELLHVVTHSFGTWTKGSMSDFVRSLPVYDRSFLEKTLTMLVVASEMDTASCQSGGATSRGRITVQRFRPTEVAKRASIRLSMIEDAMDV